MKHVKIFESPEFGNILGRTRMADYNSIPRDESEPKNLIDISKIIEMGNATERSFFSWLSKNSVTWYQVGSNLNQIVLLIDEDFDKVKEVWDEIEQA